MNRKKKNKYIELDKIYSMLFHEEKYVIEFAEASILSFSEFSEHYSKFLIDRDIENLRRAGHKIKPVVQMLELDEILVEYEQAKQMLEDERPKNDLAKSAERITKTCEQIVKEFEQIISDMNK